MLDAPPVSPIAQTIWAKTHADTIDHQLIDGWLPLHQHLDDSAEIAGHLWDEWVPPAITRTLAGAFGSESTARAVVVWLAGTHDVGKASPAFAVQVAQLAQPMQDAGLPINGRIAGTDIRRRVRHEIVSFLAIRTWLQEQHGMSRAQATGLASVAAAHHGSPASPTAVRNVEPLDDYVGVAEWQVARAELLARADAQWLPDGLDLASFSPTQPVLGLLSALVIIADWLASSDLFPQVPLGEQPAESAATRAERAWRELRFPPPWSAPTATPDAAELMSERFDLPEGARPHATQIAVVERALTAPQPELMILEAEMGSGKTEAALLAAEILAGRFGLGGIFVGLPTRATADGMFGRVIRWAQRLRLDTPSSVALTHSTANLNTEYAALVRASFRSIGAQPGGGDDDTIEPLLAHRWFAAPRRGPLSNFVVGTVDQALFAAHRSRHVMLRHLALAGKVVIIDEAHAYDTYMSTYLTRALEWLGAYGVPVIMLSATLPSSRRIEFHHAYRAGRDSSRQSTENPDATPPALVGEIGYPVLTATAGSTGPFVAMPASSGVDKVVTVEAIADDDDALLRIVREAVDAGANVAIIRNVVRRAQQTADLLRSRLGDIPIVVAHSHFLAADRAEKDRRLLQTYGRNGDRPRGSVVVATQVIEQSLDIDFDLLISDIAPMDLLLQRVGRLHRHERGERPAPARAPRLVVTGVDSSGPCPSPESGSVRVYGKALLLRTLAALRERPSLTLPSDIAPFVEAVYANDASTLIPETWADTYRVAERAEIIERTEKHRKSEVFAITHVGGADTHLLGWVRAPDVDPELSPPGRATVRDSDGDTLEVIVLQRGEGGTLYTPDWLTTGGAEQIPDNAPPSAALTRTILTCRLRLPTGMCAGNAIDRHIETLERVFELPVWHSIPALKGELVLVLDRARTGQLNEYDLRYDPEEGFRFDRARPAPTRAI